MISPEFRQAVADALKAANITDPTRVDAITAKLISSGWAWCGDSAGSVGFIASEAANIRRDALALATEGTAPTSKPTPPPVDLRVFGHEPAAWKALSAIDRQRLMQAGIEAARRRGEDAELLAARTALGNGVATNAQQAAVAAADLNIRVAANSPSDRANIARTRKLADAKLADELVAANGAALQAVSSDPLQQRLAASGGAHAVRNAKRDLATVERTLKDSTISANMRAYCGDLKKKAEATLARYGVDA